MKGRGDAGRRVFRFRAVNPSVIVDELAGQKVVRLGGDWAGAATLPELGPVVRSSVDGGAGAVGFDGSGLGRWDTRLIGWLLRLAEAAAGQGKELDPSGLPDGARKLLHLALAVPEGGDTRRSKHAEGWLGRIGEAVGGAGRGTGAWIEFLGEAVVAGVRLVRGRAQFRWRDAVLVMQECGPEALGVVGLINLLVGIILAFVGAEQLAQFGATVFVADLVAVATLREMGCMMTAVIVCGRTGAAFAAQLGTMKVNEEIDAFRTFGFAPSEFLVLPRLMALALIMPLLCVYADLIAIMGGLATAVTMLDVSPAEYLGRTRDAVELSDFLLGLVKGSAFGILVALTGCLRGMQCGGNAAAVGLATTSAVVTGITGIIAADALFAFLCRVVGV